MRSFARALSLTCLLAAGAVIFAQEAASEAATAVEPAPVVVTPAPAPAPVVRPSLIPTPVPSRADALELYRQGRTLEAAGKTADAQAKYRSAITICDQEIAQDSTRMDAYAVKCWCLFRVNRFQEVVDVGTIGLRVKYDPRLSEVMGEAYYHLNNFDLALKNLQKYIENAGEYGDRVSTAYFYMGETYLRLKSYDHADIAYSLAVNRDPSMARWWFRYGQSVELQGDWKRAADHYTRALKLQPDMQEATDALARAKTHLN
jgi:tetratricopeptide (TPR) repeat protein